MHADGKGTPILAAYPGRLIRGLNAGSTSSEGLFLVPRLLRAGERVRRTWRAFAEAYHSRRGIPLHTGAGYIPLRPRPRRRGLLPLLGAAE